jgi:hypothetical protein
MLVFTPPALLRVFGAAHAQWVTDHHEKGHPQVALGSGAGRVQSAY